jgi:hypothetical protein
VRLGNLAALILGTALAFSAEAAPTVAERIEGLRDRVELAYLSRSIDGLEAARAELLSLPALAADSARAPYFAAFARFRQSLLTSERATARGWLEDCIGELESYLEVEQKDAEARALLGSCYGISTRYNKLAMATRGLEARKHMAAARKLAPQNPVVLLQDGLADFSTPALFGGDRKLAIAKLEQAAKIFGDAARNGSRVAAWGLAEAWDQLAHMYRETGRMADADAARARARALMTAGGGTRIAGI